MSPGFKHREQPRAFRPLGERSRARHCGVDEYTGELPALLDAAAFNLAALLLKANAGLALHVG
jgi:hypothetical protein